MILEQLITTRASRNLCHKQLDFNVEVAGLSE